MGRQHRLDPFLGGAELDEYPAAYGPASGVFDVSMGESIEVGVREAIRVAAGRPFVTGRYSQGAIAARHLARAAPGQCQGVATLADPHTEGRRVIAGVPPGHRSGISGPYPVDVPVLTEYVAADPIPDLPDGNPARLIADLTEWMSIRGVHRIGWWLRDVHTKVRGGHIQRWWSPWRRADILATPMFAHNYWPGTKHTTDLISAGHCARLAQRANDRFRGWAPPPTWTPTARDFEAFSQLGRF
ncbi:hypothetical protein ACLQ3C_14065 [Gordonia sp. DT30]|uniref:hypothetical protein n=1 Tax=Gordonia sp. DT30 TaxID=3416546 RepID=UPI003CF896D7